MTEARFHELNHFYEFGPFRVDPTKRLLLRDGQPQSLTPKAFEILLVLLRHRDRVVEKDNLMRAVWPDTVVEENNLTRNISALRKALGEGPHEHSYLVTVPGRGYGFVAEVREIRCESTRDRNREHPAIEARAGDSGQTHPNNIPSQLNCFIGRTAELDEIEHLLRHSDLRLLTLSGAGGTGKTRLALRAAADLLENFSDGVFFVGLAAIRQPDLVVSAIAQTLRVKEATGTPLIKALTDYLSHKQLLLVLDNFEHVLAAAPSVTELLVTCPRLKVMVTSRAALHLTGEHEFPVQPLSVPDAAHSFSVKELSQCDSIALFIERARAVKPDFEINDENAKVVANVCIRLDGLPLAIELAAARIKLLSPQAMLMRFENRLKLLVGGPRDLPARQQTMRDTIAWSYELLDESGKRLFRTLAVFIGGFSIESAVALSKTEGEPEIDVLESLGSLVDKSLLVQKEQRDGEPRFMMLETFREYGLEQLEACGEMAAVRRTHANFFRELVEHAEPELSSAEQGMWLDRLGAEHDNIRAALRWAKENNEVDFGSRMAEALGRFWLIKGYYTEGREILAEFLGSTTRTERRPTLLTSAGILAQNQGDYGAARSYFEESLEIWRSLGNKQGIASSLNNLGWVAWRQSDYKDARALSEEGLSLNRELGNKQGIAHSLNNLGYVMHHQGDYQAARSLHEESLCLRRELGDRRGIAFAQNNLGWALQKQGLYEPAKALLEEAIAQFKQLGDKQLLAFSSCRLAEVLYDEGNSQPAMELLEDSVTTCREIGAKYSLAFSLCILGNASCDQGNHLRAAALLDESISTFREIGDRYGVAYALCVKARISFEQGNYQGATSLFEESLTLRVEIGDKHGILSCLEGLGRVALAEDDFLRAFRLFEVAAKHRDVLKIQLSAAEQDCSDRSRVAARSSLDEAVVESVCAEAKEMTLEHAFSFALS
jgi:predicted ATPase/Flp pilus assembly protein TadD